MLLSQVQMVIGNVVLQMQQDKWGRANAATENIYRAELIRTCSEKHKLVMIIARMLDRPRERHHLLA